jgi:hypothetical protein
VTAGVEGISTMPQADPNGLFMPESADATWVLMLDPLDRQVKPCYFEERVECFPFKLRPELVVGG